MRMCCGRFCTASLWYHTGYLWLCLKPYMSLKYTLLEEIKRHFQERLIMLTTSRFYFDQFKKIYKTPLYARLCSLNTNNRYPLSLKRCMLPALSRDIGIYRVSHLTSANQSLLLSSSQKLNIDQLKGTKEGICLMYSHVTSFLWKIPAARAAEAFVSLKTSVKCSTAPAPLLAITGMLTASETNLIRSISNPFP